MLSRLAICLWSTSYGFCFCPLFKFSPILFLLKFLSFALTLSPFLNSLFCLQICIDLNIFELILLPRNIFEFIILSTDLYWSQHFWINSFASQHFWIHYFVYRFVLMTPNNFEFILLSTDLCWWRKKWTLQDVAFSSKSRFNHK